MRRQSMLRAGDMLDADPLVEVGRGREPHAAWVW